MVLRKMFGFIEDVGLRVNLETSIGRTQTGRDLADADNRHHRVIARLERLLAEFAAEGKPIFVKNVPQPLGHAESAAKKNDFTAGFEGLPDDAGHVLDPSVKLFARLAFDKERGSRRAKLFEIHATIPGRLA